MKLADVWEAIVNFTVGLFKNIKIGALSVFGKIKIYKWPFWIVFDPKGYDVKASHIRKGMAMAQPGDVFVRRYRNFLDGYFIPGRFSHSGVYVGGNLIVHAMGDGVQKIDIIDFLRCDGFAILRPMCTAETKKRACEIAKSFIGRSYDYDFDIASDYRDEAEVKARTRELYCHELSRSCFPTLDIPMIAPSLWRGMIRSKKRQFLAQSFFDSPDFSVVYDSDYGEPRCSVK